MERCVARQPHRMMAMNQLKRTNNVTSPRDPWIKNLIEELGGLAAVAEYLKVSQPAVTQWKSYIPADSAVRLMIWATERDLDLGMRDFFPYYFDSPSELTEPETIA